MLTPGVGTFTRSFFLFITGRWLLPKSPTVSVAPSLCSLEGEWRLCKITGSCLPLWTGRAVTLSSQANVLLEGARGWGPGQPCRGAVKGASLCTRSYCSVPFPESDVQTGPRETPEHGPYCEEVSLLPKYTDRGLQEASRLTQPPAPAPCPLSLRPLEHARRPLSRLSARPFC